MEERLGGKRDGVSWNEQTIERNRNTPLLLLFTPGHAFGFPPPSFLTPKTVFLLKCPSCPTRKGQRDGPRLGDARSRREAIVIVSRADGRRFSRCLVDAK